MELHLCQNIKMKFKVTNLFKWCEYEDVIVFVCAGVNHDALKKVGEHLSVHKGAGAAGAKAVYRGGE